jgi:P-type Ca2+ transporter type 2C
LSDLERFTSPIQPRHVILPGRARFHVRGLYHCPALKRAIERGLAVCNQVNRVSANPLTGNVLVEFDNRLDSTRIAELIQDAIGEGNNSGRNGRLSAEPNLGSFPSASDANAPSSALHSGAQAPIADGRLRKSAQDSWHCCEVQAVVDRLGSSSKGLSERVAAERLRSCGPNRLPEREAHSPIAILLDQFDSMPTALLIAAAGISIFTGGVADAIAIGGVLAINAAIGFLTERESENAIRSLKSIVRPSAAVVRDGNLQQVRSERVVPGDVITLKPGSYVCADARLIEAEHLTVDGSALTGESLPVAKIPEALGDESLALAARSNMVYMGTRVTGGQGLAMVVATGANTELGLVHKLTGETQSPETPMERQLARVGRQLVLACTTVCGLILGIGLLRGYGLAEMLQTAISLAVASVPEGLPAVAATTLALGVLKMRRHGVIIRKLDAVETLGCVQTICLDKTGTLTLNRMEVTLIHCDTLRLKFSGGAFFNAGLPFRASGDAAMRKLGEICVLCSETEIERRAGQYAFGGSSTENALVHMALHTGIHPIALRSQYPNIKMIGRSEDRNFMCTLHEIAHGGIGSFQGKLLVAVKGSPSEVLAMCRWHISDTRRVPLTEADRSRIVAENDEMAGAALRVLGIAYRELKTIEQGTRVERDLVWLGLVAMADPIRGGVSDAIRAFHRAGIDTVMITGDQHETAFAVGRALALNRSGPLRVFERPRLDDLDELREQTFEHAQVFARVSPVNKLQIVQALQRAGKVVAMTGDGINDSPALKAADIGIAMGSSGTDAAREVGDVVLENDDLQTVLVAIGEGRTIYRNIRKSLHFLLATNFSEIIVMFVALAAGLGSPLNAMQLLWINLISDVFPGLALALESPEPDVMSEAPRDPREPVLKGADFRRIATESAALSCGALAAYGYGLARYGAGAHASSLAFTSLTSGQLLHAASCRSGSHSVFSHGMLPINNYLTAALAGSYGMQALAFLIPGLRNLLGLTPIGAADGMIIAAGALAPFVVNEATKLLTFSGAADAFSHAQGRPALDTLGDRSAAGPQLKQHRLRKA